MPNLSKASFTSVVMFPSWSVYIQLEDTDGNYIFGVVFLLTVIRLITLEIVERKEKGGESSHFEGEDVCRSR